MIELISNFLSLGLAILYISLAELHIPPLEFTMQEVKRRAKSGDKDFKHDIWLEGHRESLSALIQLIKLLVLALFICLVAYSSNLFISLILSAAVILLGRATGVSGLFSQTHAKIISQSKKYLSLGLALLKPILKNKKHDAEPTRSFYSTEEFLTNLEADGEVLDQHLYTKLVRTLSASTKRVSSLMIQFEKLPLVEASTLLTPVLYNDLHNYGLGVALVYRDTQDNLIGVFNLASSESVSQIKTNMMISERMEEHVELISENSTLEEAIKQLTEGRHSVLVVRSVSGKIVGAISLKQIAAHIFGLDTAASIVTTTTFTDEISDATQSNMI